MTKNTPDVAIIGAGPVGLTLANALGQRGRSVLVLEQESEGYALPRAVTFDDEVMRIFQSIGLSEEMESITDIGSHAQFVDGAGNVLVKWERPEGRTPNGWQVNNRFHQPTLEQVLRDGLDRFQNVEIQWNSTVTNLTEKGNSVEIEIDGNPACTASFVVGCDGGRSFTRKWIGGGAEDLGFHEPWLIVDLLNHQEEKNPDRMTTHYCGTERMGSKVYTGPHRKRWEFRVNPDDDLDTICDHENVWNLLAPWVSPDVAEIERVALYTFHSLIARNWRRGRVFIAGDAAHQTPPFMGQGMCAGIRDAANLCWKLDRALHGDGPEGLLDTYESERKPHVRQFIDLTMNLGRLINATAKGISSDVAKGEFGAQNMSLIHPSLGPGLAVVNLEKRGELFPQITTDKGVRLDDALGNDFGLIVCEWVPQPLKSDFENKGIPIVVAKSAAEILGHSPGVLIRPDRAVVGYAEEDISELLPENWIVQ